MCTSLAIRLPAVLPTGKSRISRFAGDLYRDFCAVLRPRTTRSASPIATLPVLHPVA